ncbi:MAG: hypothetical protein CBD01_003015 [Euryarchaeota archaeon TMED141]|nr:MAG: hypothetical protein CBD01_003015 [Euryarchaeota archaeon TMED141]DAC09937.1 MAG TPA: hypothetical protein D7I09_04840 [Candidatus Poseidoniales archaeon]HII18652.1 hypothetical protein [Candidatus Poseidoniaceae archaeon]
MSKTSPLMREGALSRLGSLRRHPAVAFARASLVVLIALNAAVSVWLIAEFEGQYTEGPPSPARFYALAGVDGEYTMIDVSIENSTRLLVYQLIRDDVGPEDDVGGGAGGGDDGSSDAPTSSEQDSVNRLDRARTWIQVTVGLLILLEVLVTFVGISGWFRAAGFLAVLVAFLVMLPLAFIGDNPNFADPGSTPNSAPEEAEQTENDEQGAFVHEETDFGVGLRYGGFEVSMMYAGYDLGLVEEDNRSSVRETPPEPGTKDAASYVKFDSTLSLRFGPSVVLILALPVFWLLAPSGRKRDATLDESE